jgi:glucose/arabinose dehydrogenase
VIATCLDPVSAVAVLPDGQSALVAERASGRIVLVQKGRDPQPYATVAVDPAGGGLIGLVLSPTYRDDQLVYAYAATPTDHRVVRIAKGFPPVPILTGIPRTEGSPAGALSVGRGAALLVATGSGTPNPGPGSLAGKLLRIDTFGHPLRDNPNPQSPIFSSGLLAPAGLCVAPDTGAVWVTDRAPDRDLLYQIAPGQLGDPAWSWPDRPGVAGCVAPPGSIAVAEQGGSALFLLRTGPQGGFTGTPQTLLAGTYGRLAAATLAPDGLIWLGTTNKGGGGPVVSSDDRVIRIQPPSGGASSGPD